MTMRLITVKPSYVLAENICSAGPRDKYSLTTKTALR